MRPRLRKTPHATFEIQPPRSLSRYQCLRKPQQHPFSSTSHRSRSTLLRRTMFKWLNGPGVNFKNPLPGSTNYLNAYDYSGELIRVKDRGERKPSDDDTPATEDAEMPSTSEMNLQGNKPIPKESLDDLMPFPQNRQFRSQPVLSEEFKDEIYERVVRQGQHIRRVCNDLHVDMARVGAVVRLKAIEEEWKQQGKRIQTTYARAVLSMLPVSKYSSKSGPTTEIHDHISDIPVHRSTLRQLFLSVPESRPFTRADAAAALDPHLLPIDARVPHPQLIAQARDRDAGLTNQDRVDRIRERETQEREALEKRARKQRARDEAAVTKVVPPRGRWEFRFRNVSADQVDGEQDRRGVGVRYGVPAQDRKKGAVKIPQRVVPV